MQRIKNLEFFLEKKMPGPCEMPLQEFSAEESMTVAMPNQVNGTLGGHFGDKAHSGELPPGDILLDATDLPMPPGSVFEGQFEGTTYGWMLRGLGCNRDRSRPKA